MTGQPTNYIPPIVWTKRLKWAGKVEQTERQTHYETWGLELLQDFGYDKRFQVSNRVEEVF